MVVVYTNDGEVLILKRVKPFEFWQSVTGSLQPAENHDEAARRELLEETGLQNELHYTGVTRQFTIDERWRDRFSPGVVENVEYEYMCPLAARQELRLSSAEHSAAKWTDIDDAIATVWSWTNRRALESLKATL